MGGLELSTWVRVGEHVLFRLVREVTPPPRLMQGAGSQ